MFLKEISAVVILACALWSVASGDCEYNGASVPAGQIATEDACQHCECKDDSTVVCSHMHCPMIPSECADGTQPAAPPGLCCPVCQH